MAKRGKKLSTNAPRKNVRLPKGPRKVKPAKNPEKNR